MNAILSEKGQVTIPKIIRDELGLEAGVVLDFHEEQGRIIVTKVTKNSPFSAWRGKGKIPGGQAVMEYLSNVREGV
jgi:AbrB family looped-hinge helix DNA binding protein